MKFFDYVFYNIYWAYLQYNDSSPDGAAACLISLLQGLNILTCKFIFEIITGNKISINNYIIILLGIFLLIINFKRYIHNKKFQITVLQSKWDSESVKVKIKKRIITLSYIIISIILCIALAIYLGSIKSPRL